MKFWESERYKKADELVKKHATGFCVDQISLPHGGVLEKWIVGNQIVVLLAERSAPENRPTREDGEEFRVEVLAPVTTSTLWEDVDKALAALTNHSAKKESPALGFYFVELDNDKPRLGSTGYAVHKDGEVIADGFSAVAQAATFAGLANIYGPEKTAETMLSAAAGDPLFMFNFPPK